MRVLLFGASGMLGSALRRALAPVADHVYGPPHSDVDLLDPGCVRRVVLQERPNLIVNAAAYTRVDAAEYDTAAAHALNATAPGVLARAAAEVGSRFFHFSTDFVFDGTAGRPYTECDVTRPVNAYGRTKLAGEHAVREAGASHVIIRIGWLFARHGRGFFQFVREGLASGRQLRVVKDQWGTPTSACAVATSIARLARSPLFSTIPPVLHLSSGEVVSRLDFARAIGEHDARKLALLQPILSDEITMLARRPAFTVLSSDYLFDLVGLRLPPWRQQLEEELAPENEHTPP